MREPASKATLEYEILRNEIFANRFGGVCGVLEDFIAISEKPPTPKPVCSRRRSLQPNRVSKNDGAKRNDARYRIAKQRRVEMCKIA